MAHKIWIKDGLFLTIANHDTNDVVTSQVEHGAGELDFVLLQGHMVITDDRISYVGAEPPNEAEGTFDEVIDGRHRLYMPGLVNTHGHAAMSLLRGYADDLALQVWLEQHIWPFEAKMKPRDVHTGTLVSIIEMLKGGTTTFVDMYADMDQVALAVEQSGIRASLTQGIIGIGEPDVVDEKLRLAIKFAREWHNEADGRIQTMMAPHAPYTCPPALIERIVQASHDLEVPIHIHMSETLFEVEENYRQYRRRPVAHLQALGVFDRPTLVAHAVHLNDEEIEMLSEYDVHVSHNPVSNLKLASGIARVPEMLKSGVVVGIGTDGCASNNNLDMFEEMRLAAILHKGVCGDPTVIPAAQALRMGTVDGARAIWRSDIGALQLGMKADIIGINIDQPHFMPVSHMVSHLVYVASAQDVADVWVNGRQLVNNRELLTLDEEKILSEFRSCYARLSKDV